MAQGRGRQLAVLVSAWVLAFGAQAEPPFGGTAFLDPDIITAATPTRFVAAVPAGQAMRTMFDRRINAFASYNAYLFNATYSDGLQIEFQVNPEFGSVGAAQAVVDFYAPVIGRLPRGLRQDVQTSWIHQGDEAFGGGNDNLLIHTGTLAQSYIDLGALEEILAHEATHTSLDAALAGAPAWLAAQAADPDFISTYARDNPTREDVAESLVPWLALQCARDRIDSEVATTIEATIPNRLAVFDAAAIELAPLVCNPERVYRDGFEG